MVRAIARRKDSDQVMLMLEYYDCAVDGTLTPARRVRFHKLEICLLFLGDRPSRTGNLVAKG
jgi:hypothetical protein